VAFGLAAFPIGLYLWHKQGPDFGLGKAEGTVNTGAAFVSAGMLLTLIGAELVRNVR
jgi:hypothetical protein